MIGQSSTFADMGCLDIESEIFMYPEARVNLASKYPIHFEKLDLIVLKTDPNSRQYVQEAAGIISSRRY